jgi:DNA-binding LacI/PurR family transcriptional regulator
MNDIATRIHVDPALAGTLAQQIREQVTWLISGGDLVPCDELPSARSLAAAVGVNFHTVRGAYRRLEADGLVEMRHGRRCRVAPFDPRRLWPEERAARTHLVGIVLPSLANPFYAELLEGAEAAARDAETLLVVVTTHDDQAQALRSIGQLAVKGVDGVVVVSHDISILLNGGAVLDPARRLPLVVVDRPGLFEHSVESDLEGAGYIAARHLAEEGHCEIGLVTHEACPSNVVPIEVGFRRAIAEAGLRLDERHVVRVDGWNLAAGVSAATRVLTWSHRPSALVAIADLLAIGVIRELRRGGVQVPAEIAVVGIDDIPMAALVEPALTTVALPGRAMGAEAVRTLVRTWSLGAGEPGPASADATAAEPERIVLDVNLVVRESCGPHSA